MHFLKLVPLESYPTFFDPNTQLIPTLQSCNASYANTPYANWRYYLFEVNDFRIAYRFNGVLGDSEATARSRAKAIYSNLNIRFSGFLRDTSGSPFGNNQYRIRCIYTKSFDFQHKPLPYPQYDNFEECEKPVFETIGYYGHSNDIETSRVSYRNLALFKPLQLKQDEKNDNHQISNSYKSHKYSNYGQ